MRLAWLAARPACGRLGLICSPRLVQNRESAREGFAGCLDCLTRPRIIQILTRNSFSQCDRSGSHLSLSCF